MLFRSNDTATTEIYTVYNTVSLHDALPISPAQRLGVSVRSFTQPYQPSPKGGRVGLRIVLFEACSAFTRVTACTLAPSPYIVTR